MQIPASSLKQGEFTNVADVVNMYAKYTISQGVPIIDAMVSVTPGNVNLPGSAWAPFIPEGLTAYPSPLHGSPRWPTGLGMVIMSISL